LNAVWCWRRPGSITPHKKFTSEVYVLKKDEGGRHKAFFSGYQAAVLHPHDGCDRRDHPAWRRGNGDARRQRQPDVELIMPVALEKGSKFAIREGGLTVGAGVITEILE
jgi:elongation factor Tu